MEAIQPSVPGLGIHKISHLAELTRSTTLDAGSGLGPSGRRKFEVIGKFTHDSHIFIHDSQTIALADILNSGVFKIFKAKFKTHRKYQKISV